MSTHIDKHRWRWRCGWNQCQGGLDASITHNLHCELFYLIPRHTINNTQHPHLHWRFYLLIQKQDKASLSITSILRYFYALLSKIFFTLLFHEIMESSDGRLEFCNCVCKYQKNKYIPGSWIMESKIKIVREFMKGVISFRQDVNSNWTRTVSNCMQIRHSGPHPATIVVLYRDHWEM